MNLAEIILIILFVQITNIFLLICFMFISGNKHININPIKAYQEHKQQEEDDKENKLKEKQLLESLENIDIFDGTSVGQKNISTEI